MLTFDHQNAAADGAFTVVVIPDTQFLSQDFPAHFDALADWIVANRDAYNIGLVLHLGDVVHVPNTTQYDAADGPMTTLYDSGIPFVAAIGNHDYQGGSSSGDVTDDRTATLWNNYFGTDRYTGQPWWDGGFKDAGKSENMFLRTTLGGVPTLVLVLEFFPRAATMTWAEGVIEEHPHHQVIMLTHAFLTSAGERAVDGTSGGPDSYTITDATSAEDMWQDVLRRHPNVVQVYGGHFTPSGLFTGDRTDYTDPGTLTYQQFTNWQHTDQGGDGRIVLMQAAASHRWGLRQVYNARQDQLEDVYEQPFPWASYLDLPLLDQRYAAAPDPGPEPHSASRTITVDPGVVTVDDSGDDVVVTVDSSKWGYDDDGPYYDTTDVEPGDEAALLFDPDEPGYLVVPYGG